ncbi:hypothetical protein CCACVL1_11031 [Corchorus capsularis]|uniref:Uncharacterized protein n=1 Tax=Corchorus capsularis TaxID=210143 RepID=A0A1R3IN90_COCAP|nr:hypothetical protein CCACVL1_11031 [Corchorus capsularis]
MEPLARGAGSESELEEIMVKYFNVTG